MTDRSREAIAFTDTIDRTAPQAISARDGWTAHEIEQAQRARLQALLAGY